MLIELTYLYGIAHWGWDFRWMYAMCALGADIIMSIFITLNIRAIISAIQKKG